MFSFYTHHIQPIGRLDVSYSSFISCSNENGGAILSSFDGYNFLRHCSFFLCNADGSVESRGGAFYLQKGIVIIKDCCANTCNADFGSDMLVFYPKKLNLLFHQASNLVLVGIYFFVLL